MKKPYDPFSIHEPATNASPSLTWEADPEQRWLQACGIIALIRDVVQQRPRSDRETVRRPVRRVRRERRPFRKMSRHYVRRHRDRRIRCPLWRRGA